MCPVPSTKLWYSRDNIKPTLCVWLSLSGITWNTNHSSDLGIQKIHPERSYEVWKFANVGQSLIRSPIMAVFVCRLCTQCVIPLLHGMLLVIFRNKTIWSWCVKLSTFCASTVDWMVYRYRSWISEITGNPRLRARWSLGYWFYLVVKPSLELATDQYRFT